MREILDEETYLQTPKPNNCIAVNPSTERKVSVRVFHASTFERSLRDLLPFVASIPERKIGLGTAPEYIIGPCDVFKEGIPVFKDFQSAADANALNRKGIALKFQEARTHQGDMGQLVISDPAPKILAP